jgi:hypothetical protein
MDDMRSDVDGDGTPDGLERLRNAAVIAATVWIATQTVTALWLAARSSDALGGPFGSENAVFTWIAAASTIANAVFFSVVGIYLVSWLEIRRRAER